MYNFFLEKLLLPFGDIFMGTSFMKNLKYWRKVTKLSEQQLADLQKERLYRLLVHASQNVPFYNNLNTKRNSNPYEWLKQFPVIKKPLIKAHLDEFVLGDQSKLVVETSSGSSGVQGKVFMNKEEDFAQQALQWLWWEWAGYKIGNSVLQTGTKLKRTGARKLKDIFFRTTYISAFSLAEEEQVAILKQLQKKPLDHFVGFASSLYVMAQIAQKHGINDVKFKSIISWGEQMLPHFKELLESQFSTRVYDTYGCTEGFKIAAQYDRPNDYYIFTPQVYIEILDDEFNEVKDGELGYVVVTRLDAYTMPLIRYYLGDLAIKGKRKEGEKYELGFPILEKVMGRDTDLMHTASGKIMTLIFFTGTFKHFPEIAQFRVIQRTLDEIEIEYIPDESFKPDALERLRNKIQGDLKEPYPVRFKEVKEIPRLASGKVQLMSNLVNKTKQEVSV